MVSRISANAVRVLLVSAALTFAMAALAQATAPVTARVDRNSLVEGETLTLVLQTNDSRQSLEADLSALESDFILLDQRSETQMSIVNGQQSAVIRKMITLEPRRAGRLTIPALEVGGVRTQPVTIHVDEAPEPPPGTPEPVFIEVALNPDEGPYYVHAQLGLTVRLFYQQSLTEAAISQPEPENGSVRLLDEVPYQADRNGQQYRVLERRYAIFPERSGPMTIPPLVLSGRLVQRGSSRLWEPSRRGRRITVESEPVTFEVAPRPDSFSGSAWQPARSYRLGEELSTSGDIRVGEPVTRTITIDAVGLEENMIAEPSWEEIPGTRIYPDQPQGISRNDGEWVLGHKAFRYAVVPESEGELVLPEVSVAWWDTVADRERVSVLPARSVQVLPAPVGAGPAPAAAAATDPAAQASTQVGSGATGRGYWKWLAFVFAGLWLLTLWYAAKGRQRQPRSRAQVVEESEAELLGDFRRACKAGQAAAARKALRSWLRRFAPVGAAARSSLVDFARECGSDSLAEALRELDAAGFNPDESEDWDGRRLYRAWREWRRDEAGSGTEKPQITDLYAPANR